MPDRTERLRALADRVSDHEGVVDAWLAKSFTDQLFVVDLHTDHELPAEIESVLADHGLYGVHEVYETEASTPACMGTVGEASRHQFVDVQTRGDHQSYVQE